MDAQTALKNLLQISCEYVGTLKDRPATQGALMAQIKLAHDVIAEATKPQDVTDKEVGNGIAEA